MTVSHEQLVDARAAIAGVVGDAIIGLYLYGSAVSGGIGPDSDLDLFAVVRRPLTDAERLRLVEALTPISDRNQRPAGWRPVELTMVLASELRPWRYPPRMEFLFGEWMRPAFERGEIPFGRRPNRDLAVVASMVRADGRALMGPPATDLVDDVPLADVLRATVDTVDGLLEDLRPDTRNVLLTLARMWCTAVTDRIVSKAQAADWAIERLGPATSEPLRRARAAYVGDAHDDWTGSALVAADRLAAKLVENIRGAASR